MSDAVSRPEMVGADEEIKIASPSYSGDIRFTDPRIAASKLGSILIDRYGEEWLSWDPETIWQTITQDFSTAIHPVNKEKINAAKTLLMTDDFWIEWQAFEKVVKAFNNFIPSFHMMEGASPAEMAWAVEQAKIIRVFPYSQEVIAYIRANADNLGWVWLPEELRFAQPNPITDLEKQVALAWNEVSQNLNFKVEEDEVGIQLARLNAVRHYLRKMRGESEEVMMKSEKRW